MIQENNKTDLYMVQNGVGKCVLFSNMIEDLYKKGVEDEQLRRRRLEWSPDYKTKVKNYFDQEIK